MSYSPEYLPSQNISHATNQDKYTSKYKNLFKYNPPQSAYKWKYALGLYLGCDSMLICEK